MPDGFVVRPARGPDAAGVAAVIEQAVRRSASGFYSAEQIAAWAEPVSAARALEMIGGTFAVVAIAADRVIGLANLAGAEVDQLYVDPDAGGRGVARALYQAVEQEALARGLVALDATASLRAAPAFTRFGFTVVERVDRRFNGEVFPVVRMRKALSRT